MSSPTGNNAVINVRLSAECGMPPYLLRRLLATRTSHTTVLSYASHLTMETESEEEEMLNV